MKNDISEALEDLVDNLAELTQNLWEALKEAAKKLVKVVFESGIAEVAAAQKVFRFMRSRPAVENIRTRHAEAARRASGEIIIRTLGPKRYTFRIPSDAQSGGAKQLE